MGDLWAMLEERTRAWDALRRGGVADAIWSDYVSIRFGRTGDPRALQFLYPYLNHCERSVRLEALAVAARVFEGRGPRAVGLLDYITRNPDPFLRDRGPVVVGAAVAGAPDRVILEALSTYLGHANQFVRKLALVALGRAAFGQASEVVLREIVRVAALPGPRPDEERMAVAHVFAAHPNEGAFRRVAGDGADVACPDRDSALAVAILVRGAGEGWLERACREVFEPRLHCAAPAWQGQFMRRAGVTALCHAARGRGMDALRRMLHLAGERCAGHALLSEAQQCFVGAPAEGNRAALIGLATTGDVPTQRVAALCLGRLLAGADDREAITLLAELCEASNRAVQAAALAGLGLAARSTCDEALRRLCLDKATDPETSVTAVQALGMVYLGSGRTDVLADLSNLARDFEARPVRGRTHCKPLAACYRAIGLVYLGTGSAEPLDLLCDVLSRPSRARMDEYHWAAAKALVTIEFSEARLAAAGLL